MTKSAVTAGITPQAPRAPQTRPSRPSDRAAFTHALEKALDREDVRFTKHARDRITERRIDMSERDIHHISEAMSEIRGRGGKISILLMGETALVTDVGKRTVITALGKYGEQTKVFTNIDSAVFIEKG